MKRKGRSRKEKETKIERERKKERERDWNKSLQRPRLNSTVSHSIFKDWRRTTFRTHPTPPHSSLPPACHYHPSVLVFSFVFRDSDCVKYLIALELSQLRPRFISLLLLLLSGASKWQKNKKKRRRRRRSRSKRNKRNKRKTCFRAR